MKKILYTTTALVAATLISSAAMADGYPVKKSGSSMSSKQVKATSQMKTAKAASRAPQAFKASVGGFANWYVGYADNDIDRVNEFDVLGDVEVHFNFETALRNGLKIGAHMELEAGTNSVAANNSMDQSYMYVESQFGKLMVGRHNNANKQLHVRATDVGALDIQETDLTDLIIGDGIIMDELSTTYFFTDNKHTKLTYLTPNFSGFQAGLTYAAAGNDTKDNFLRGTGNDSTVLAVAYEGKLRDMGFAVSAGYGFNTFFGTPGDENLTQWNIGARVMVKGFTVSAAYKDLDQNDKGDGKVWDIGVSYEQGPYGVSLSYISGEFDNEVDKQNTLLLSGKYTMAAGVDAFATFGWGKYEDAAGADKNDGWAIVGGMMLSF